MEAVEFLREHLKHHLHKGDVLLERYPVLNSKTVTLKDGIRVTKQEVAGYVNHRVSLLVLATLYQDVLKGRNLTWPMALDKMESKVFRDVCGNTIDPGYGRFIRTWKGEL